MIDFKKELMKETGAKDLRSQLKAIPLKKLKKRVDEDNEIIGAQSNEYLNLEDGKTLKIRIFPAHPGGEDFYIPKKCYWLTVPGRDGDTHRTTVLDSKVHGGTKMDLVEEYIKYAKKKCAKDSGKLESIAGNQQKQGLSATFSWICYADRLNGDDQLRAKIWEFKKTVRDALNKLSFNEDEDDVIEVDPFTDVDEGMPIMVKYMKNPNKKKGENYYDVSFPKKATARPLTDAEIEYFMSVKPLIEVLPRYSIKDFERALEGVQTFDEENEIGLFDDDTWLEHLEEIKAQYDSEESEEEPKKKTSKKVTKKVEAEDEEDEDEAPVAKKTKKVSKKEEPEDEEEDDDEEPEEDNEEEDMGLDGMDREALKSYIKENELDVKVKKSMSDEDIREAIREASVEEEEDDEEEDDEEEEETPKGKLSLADIKKKLASKK